MRILFSICKIFGLFLCLAFTTNVLAKEKFKVCADPLSPPYSTKKNGRF